MPFAVWASSQVESWTALPAKILVPWNAWNKPHICISQVNIIGLVKDNRYNITLYIYTWVYFLCRCICYSYIAIHNLLTGMHPQAVVMLGNIYIYWHETQVWWTSPWREIAATKTCFDLGVASVSCFAQVSLQSSAALFFYQTCVCVWVLVIMFASVGLGCVRPSARGLCPFFWGLMRH